MTKYVSDNRTFVLLFRLLTEGGTLEGEPPVYLETEMAQVSAKTDRRRGAPKGNQNARKHGFYSKTLDETERLDFELATSVEGIDDEIALLRVKIKSLLVRDPDNIKLIMQATNTLARLLRTRYNISREDKKGLKEAIGNVLKDIALPLGIGIGSVINKE
ncbi:MAG: hypothetical protein PHN78_08790 [Dehalococcoidales bacterium]|nr:hypothetical protein [Dehalococcoidales bacterium]